MANNSEYNFNDIAKKIMDHMEENNFSNIIYTLTGLSVEEEKSAFLWANITTHKDTLSDLLNRDVGLMVAALDYLYSVCEDIETPTLLESEHINDIENNVIRDELTGLYNKDTFQLMIQNMLEQSDDGQDKLSLLIIDVDNYNSINHSFGFCEGDRVIQKISFILNSICRENDQIFRLGKDNFSIILPHTDALLAYSFAERIINITDKGFKEDDQPIILSIGISEKQSVNDTAESLIKRAKKGICNARDDELKNVCFVHSE